MVQVDKESEVIPAVPDPEGGEGVTFPRHAPDAPRGVQAMPASESTCWTAIRAAAAGSPADRDELARRYLGVVRAYLAARWRGSDLRPDLEDAVQDVLVECFRQGAALAAAGAGRVPGRKAGKRQRPRGSSVRGAAGAPLPVRMPADPDSHSALVPTLDHTPQGNYTSGSAPLGSRSGWGRIGFGRWALGIPPSPRRRYAVRSAKAASRASVWRVPAPRAAPISPSPSSAPAR
jgi:hypothetical protein